MTSKSVPKVGRGPEAVCLTFRQRVYLSASNPTVTVCTQEHSHTIHRSVSAAMVFVGRRLLNRRL